jgi:hypothetical protein
MINNTSITPNPGRDRSNGPMIRPEIKSPKQGDVIPSFPTLNRGEGVGVRGLGLLEEAERNGCDTRHVRAMTGYKALEEAVSILRKYGKERAKLLNRERGDLDIPRYQLYALREKVCRELEKLGLTLRESWKVEKAGPR